MSRFLVTGGAGFIGSHLVDALIANGHVVRVLDDLSTGTRANVNARADLVIGDVSDPAQVRAAMRDVDGCFHLAAIASVVRGNEDWAGTHRVNLGGTIAVLDAARLGGRTPVVYASSAAVYGRLTGAAAEDSPTAPLSSYGADKLGSELHARAGFEVHGVPSVGFRFFNVYGERQDPTSPYSGVISLFAEALRARRPVTVHGDGLQTRDFVFVGDVVSFLLAGMERVRAEPRASVLNVCTGLETSVRDMAEVIGSVLNHHPVVIEGPARSGDVRRSVGSPARASAVLGVQARTALPAGLGQMLDSSRNARSTVALERA